MIWGKYCFLKIPILGFILLLSCERGNTPLPEIIPEISPPEGLTTTNFEFDLTKTFSYDPNQKLFVRWDWEGDSVFDTPFLHEKILSHRYYAVGVYNPRAEIMDAAGQTSDSSFQIEVEQGYSSPRPVFTISPQEGNIYTQFKFDASKTQDDEDSLSSLLFKWDFEGDGVWDTKPDNSPIVEHIYPETHLYFPKVHVEDPSGKVNIHKERLQVTLFDSCINPRFITIPEMLIQNEENIFDASESSFDCNENETLWYKWDFNNDGFYETEWLENPITSHIFPFEQKYWVKLVVKNSKGLENFIVKEFWIYHQNQPPTARFRVSTYGGNTQTSFRFDAWNSKDVEDSPSQMLSRWDFDGDGVWDTDYSYEKVEYKTYNQPGEYQVALEIIDRGQLKDTAYAKIIVGNGSNETDIVMDKRGGIYDYYGTVKIGNQWWFSKDISIYIEGVINGSPYGVKEADCEYYSFRYPFDTALIACPEGWRLPTQVDWEELFNNFNSEELFDQLAWGGDSGFNSILGGLSNRSHSSDLCLEIDKYGYYWSSTKLSDPSGISIWYITCNGKNKTVVSGFGPDINRSVRCIKDR